jgi:hypothetical protein
VPPSLYYSDFMHSASRGPRTLVHLHFHTPPSNTGTFSLWQSPTQVTVDSARGSYSSVTKKCSSTCPHSNLVWRRGSAEFINLVVYPYQAAGPNLFPLLFILVPYALNPGISLPLSSSLPLATWQVKARTQVFCVKLS